MSAGLRRAALRKTAQRQFHRQRLIPAAQQCQEPATDQHHATGAVRFAGKNPVNHCLCKSKSAVQMTQISK